MSDVNNVSGNSGNKENKVDVQSSDVEVNNSSNVVGNGESPEKNNVPKTFTQEEVNSIVQNRLKKEKDSFGLEREGLVSELDVYKKFVEGYVEGFISEFDNSVGELLKKLSIQDQLDWIQKNKDKINNQNNNTNIPETPNGGDKKTFKPSKSKFRL